MTDIDAKIEGAIKEHERKCHAKRGKWKAPTEAECLQYQRENPELSNINVHDFWKGYDDAGWIDTQGKPVRNWKLKMRTRSNCLRRDMPEPEKPSCIVCHKESCTYQVDKRGKKIPLCLECRGYFGGGNWGRLPLNEIERRVLEGKAGRKA